MARLLMILTLFSFGLSWAILGFTFFGCATLLSGFHSSYVQSTFSVAFTIAFVVAAMIEGARVMNFQIPAGLLYLLIAGLTYLTIQGTSNTKIGYYVTGHKSATIAAMVMAGVAILTEFVKEKFRVDAR